MGLSHYGLSSPPTLWRLRMRPAPALVFAAIVSISQLGKSKEMSALLIGISEGIRARFIALPGRQQLTQVGADGLN
jgi:hypothetical protein